MTAKVEFELMRPAEVTAARDAAPVAYVPVGPLEWHGPHLPLGTDGLHAHHVAVRAARHTGGIVVPTLFVGTDSLRPAGDGPQSLGALGIEGSVRTVGMDLPGFPVKSLYFHETVFGALVRETVRLLKREQWDLIVLVNGHGAPNHTRMLERIAEEEAETPSPEVLYITAWSPEFGSGHASRLETSLMLALEGDHVDVGRLPAHDRPLRYFEFGIVDGAAFDGHPNDGYAVRADEDPRDSSAEEGGERLEEEVRRLAGAVEARLAGLNAGGRREGT
jgi:creatinine amidohydrolase